VAACSVLWPGFRLPLPPAGARRKPIASLHFASGLPQPGTIIMPTRMQLLSKDSPFNCDNHNVGTFIGKCMRYDDWYSPESTM